MFMTHENMQRKQLVHVFYILVLLVFCVVHVLAHVITKNKYLIMISEGECRMFITGSLYILDPA